MSDAITSHHHITSSFIQKKRDDRPHRRNKNIK